MIESDVNAETYGTSHERPAPARVLIASASAGTSADSASGAEQTLYDAVRKLWPRAHVQCSDPFHDAGRGATTLVRELIGIATTRGPHAGQNLGIRQRHRRPYNASQWILGSWSGHTIGPAIDRAAPDLILSADPLVTAGLVWLRRHRGLSVPVGVSDDGGATATPCSARSGSGTTLGSVAHDDGAKQPRYAKRSRGDWPQHPAVEYLPAGRLEHGLRMLHAREAPAPSRPLRPEDALFLHVHTAAVPQQVGTVLVFAPTTGEPGPTPVQVAGLLRAVPGITGTLRPSGTLRRARWVPDERRTLSSLVDEKDLIRDASDLDTAIDEFFSSPLSLTTVGAARLVTGLPDGGRAVLVKLHHALGDGITVLRALLSGSDGAHRSWATPPVPPVGHAPRPASSRLIHGLWNLARAGTAPRGPTTLPVDNATRHHQRLSLPGDTVRRLARSLELSSNELLHTLFAEAASRTFSAEPSPPRRLRMMVPWSLRGMTSVRAAGNSAGVLSADLPLGVMPPVQRARRVASALRECSAGGTPEVAGAVVRSLGYLPPPLHRLACRLVYRSTWFNAIGTVLPGPRWDVRMNGAQLTMAYPILPLAPGVGLTWGAMTWGPNIALCLTGSERLVAHVDVLTGHLQAAFDELTTAMEP